MVGSGEDKGRNRYSRGGSRGGYRGRSHRQNNSNSAKEKDTNTESEKNNPFFAQFKTHASFLDQRHDKRERLVKLSRDITIESKRIIFLLHRIKQLPNEDKGENDDIAQTSVDPKICTDKENEESAKILVEAEERLAALETDTWKQVAIELTSEDSYLHLRSYTGGLQEYVEALSFYYHLKFGQMISWKQGK